MKPEPNRSLDVYRMAALGSSPAGSSFGMFNVLAGTVTLTVISGGVQDDGWEHISVTVRQRERCPTWKEMCIVKDLFWNKDESVIQFHPGHSYVNNHPFCLHLWKPPYSVSLPPVEYIRIPTRDPRERRRAFSH